ncbi:MAG: hypothetical protein MZV70_64290 [Desulfobacterales bacterium]|nr:hypothetical protein [Desulfobacterales bacterium]
MAVLSGPSFAVEVARKLPTVVTVASRNPVLAQRVQHVFADALLPGVHERGHDRGRARRLGQERDRHRCRHHRRARGWG